MASILKCGKILLRCALEDAVSNLQLFRRNADLLRKTFDEIHVIHADALLR